jgi:hypothetical protein
MSFLSPAFHHLRAAYQAEMDDLSFDSEGRDVLSQRLADKRGSLDFLLQMTELAPEMVAVVFHQGFRFNSSSVMDQIVGLELDDCPDWSELSEAVQLTPWAQTLADTFLQQADGQRFMTVAAALSYLYGKPGAASSSSSDADEDGEEREEDHDDEGAQAVERDDDEDARARDEAGADWLAEQGFDRKD